MQPQPTPDFRPLGRKAYGSIAHLPGSRTGPADRHLSPALARVCTERVRDARDHVVVLEKLDGSCVAAARVGDSVLALGREGRLAAQSPNESRRLWAAWVSAQVERFLAVLQPGERLVGEWLALAHGTRYTLTHEPFVAFDLMRDGERLPWGELTSRLGAGGFLTPGLLHEGGPLGIGAAMERLQAGGFHGAVDPVEGAVWRVERREGAGVRVEFLAKYVQHGAHLSRNARKVREDGASERFVTLRVYGLGRKNADARFTALLEDLAGTGLTLTQRLREWTVYDSNHALDRGWLEEAK